MTRFMLLPLLVLAGCQGAPVANTANETMKANAPILPAITKIPESFQGRWGLVPADCTSTGGDAKGLMTVSADRLTFYESRGRLERVLDATPDSFVGSFAFSGEGQNWTRTETLVLKNGILSRSDEEITRPLNYSRCQDPA